MNNIQTVFSALLSALTSAATFNRANEVAPAAVLWTDGERQWAPLLPRLREEGLPLLILGAYGPGAFTGPSIWLRCMIARTLPEAWWAHDVIPILYLPGVSRQELRAVEDCPSSLQPLAELQYRGVFWSQKNGKDWTIAAFLQSADGGLQIPVSNDPATREAIRHALLKLADQPVEELRKNGPLTAARCNTLLNPDEILSLLRWMDNPDAYRSGVEPEEWAAFGSTCKDRFGFDPEADGPISAAGHLGEQGGAWNLAWNRFAEAPHKYPAIPALLRQARPRGDGGLFWAPSSWPQDNDAEEASLRENLAALQDTSPAEARKAVRNLEKRHGLRREWVWASLAQAPLADVLVHLANLAEATETPLGGHTPHEMAEAYTTSGWKADAAMIQALGGVKDAADVAAVKSAAKALYFTWLREAAEAFQKAAGAHPLPFPSPPAAPAPGQCLLFADGLRFDIGQRLAGELTARGMKVVIGWQFSALPGVTPTAKPAVSPAAPLFGAGPGFTPTVKEDGARVTVDVLRRQLEKAGYAVLQGDETGNPLNPSSVGEPSALTPPRIGGPGGPEPMTPPRIGGPGGLSAWTEFGSLDSYGHNQGWKLARRVGEEVGELAERVQGLLDAGWQEVRIITDHGWLLLPGGLPRVDLPEHLAEIRKGRCARLKETASTDQQTVPWRWDPGVRIAVAPGISCYVAGKEYEHGGLSVQECVIPVLAVTLSGPVGPTVSISEVKWKGLRCHISLLGAQSGLKADLRTRAADPSTTLAYEVKRVNEQGMASLAVPDEDRAGEAAVVVILAAGGQVLAQRLTTVGGE